LLLNETDPYFLDCTYLLSEDMQHEHQIEDLTIINPFIIGANELG